MTHEQLETAKLIQTRLERLDQVIGMIRDGREMKIDFQNSRIFFVMGHSSVRLNDEIANDLTEAITNALFGLLRNLKQIQETALAEL